jgi:hypothetical protein
MTKNKPAANVAKRKYEPTSQERTALQRLGARKVVSPAPRLKVLKKEQGTSITPDHPDQLVADALLMEALGTENGDFVNGLLTQLASAGTQGGEISEGRLNFMLSVVKDLKPKDQIEAMLAAQMAAVHMATMTFAGRLAQVENVAQQTSTEGAFNKLARTFTTQMEALKRYRTGGEQKVTVQHVSVSEGGQAIVGNVTQGPRESARDKSAGSPRAIADARVQPMATVGERAPAAAPFKRKASK